MPPFDSPPDPRLPSPVRPTPAPDSENDPPISSGSGLGARDYRARPSQLQAPDEWRSSVTRDTPNAGGVAVSPMIDRTIQTYDLPDQLATYDQMAAQAPTP